MRGMCRGIEGDDGALCFFTTPKLGLGLCLSLRELQERERRREGGRERGERVRALHMSKGLLWVEVSLK